MYRTRRVGRALLRHGMAASFVALSISPGALAENEPPPLVIGMLNDLSSQYAVATGPGAVLAAQMAIEDFGPAVLGRKIEFISADTQNKTDIGVALAREWYTRRHVKAIFGVGNSAIGLALSHIAQEADGIVFTDGASADITGKSCTPNTAVWTLDTYALARAPIGAALDQGKKTFFFIGVDNALGASVERDGAELIAARGGKVLGSVKHPLGTSDYSSLLLQAQASGAEVIVFANAGADSQAIIKQAREFHVTESGPTIIATVLPFTDARAVGVDSAQGTRLTDGWYWNATEESAAFAKRFAARIGFYPNSLQADDYSMTLHYLQAVAAAGTDDTKAVMNKMRELPVNDMYTRDGHLRVDGRLVYDVYSIRVRTPAEMRGRDDGDIFQIVGKVPAQRAFQPLETSACPLAHTQ